MDAEPTDTGHARGRGWRHEVTTRVHLAPPPDLLHDVSVDVYIKRVWSVRRAEVASGSADPRSARRNAVIAQLITPSARSASLDGR